MLRNRCYNIHQHAASPSTFVDVWGLKNHAQEKNRSQFEARGYEVRLEYESSRHNNNNKLSRAENLISVLFTAVLKCCAHASEVSRNGVGVCECNEGYEENEEGTHCVEVAGQWLWLDCSFVVPLACLFQSFSVVL